MPYVILAVILIVLIGLGYLLVRHGPEPEDRGEPWPPDAGGGGVPNPRDGHGPDGPGREKQR